jgi:hypothetical protein
VTPQSFPDVSSSYAHANAIGCAAGLDLVLGKDDGRFDPQGTTTRAQLATILLRLLESSGSR